MTLLKLFILSVLVSNSLAVSKAEAWFVGMLNGDRGVLANSLQIPDMHKLEWCNELAEQADLIPPGSEFQHGSNHRAYFVLPNRSAYSWERIIEQRLFWYSKERIMETDRNHIFDLNPIEMFLPLQTKIGCVERNVTGTASNGQVMEYRAFCLLGPEGTFESWNTRIGAPGSKCGNAKVEGRLCVSESTTCIGTESSTTSP